MSALLEQAIVDASALKQAALKNAESVILDKYASEVKRAVTSLLEQDEMFAGEEEFGADEELMGAEEGALDDISLAAAEEAPLCPCPEEDEEIEVDFDYLQQVADELAQGAPADEVPLETEGEEEEEDIFAGLAEQFDITQTILEALEDDADEDDADEDDDDEGDELEEACAIEGDEDEDEMTIELTEENLDAILEELVVDIHPQKSGWAGTPETVSKHYAELKLAQMASTEAQEEIKTMKQALGNIKKDYAQMSENLKVVKSRNQKLVTTLTSMKDKLEEVNLSNARLFYTNRVLNSGSLNERQKSKIVEAISDSRSVNEAKVIYETLQNAVGSVRKSRPKSLSEAVNRTSPMMARKRGPSSSADKSAIERMQRLAGISKT